MGDVVAITGASGGIGRATARRFAQDGARIALLARGDAGLECAATEVEELGAKALVLPTDVADTIHHELRERCTGARIWGPSARFPGQQVGREYELSDGDTVEVLER